jgi:hypothetical protein
MLFIVIGPVLGEGGNLTLVPIGNKPSNTETKLLCHNQALNSGLGI